MNKLLGANWRTSVSGLIAVTCTVIAASPKLIEFIPEPTRAWVGGVAGLIAAVSAYYFVFQTKDKQVTGGSVQQTFEGKLAQPGTQTLVDLTLESPPKQ